MPTLQSSLRTTFGIAIALCALSTCAANDEFFEKRVRPLLVKHCYQCHSQEKTSGGLSLETRDGWVKGGESGPVIVVGKPQESLLVEAINYRSLKMPPPEKGGKLSDQEITTLTKWIEMGAPDPRAAVKQLGGMSAQDAKSWWSFQPLPAADPQPASKTIDAMLDKTRVSSTPVSPVADKRTLIRRATYDLIGLPPTPEEVAAFVADDSPSAFASLVDRLLDSPQYGVKWGRHWLDVVRYADTAGENSDRPLPHAWRYRNWVIDSLNHDLPYDDFIRLQIAGDILHANASDSERSEGVIATGYLAVARRYGHDIDKDIHLMYEDVIDNLGKSFLGITTGCARCHDHKYDPVTAEDYYALYGIFASTKFAFPGCEPKGQPRDLVPLIPQAEAGRIKSEYDAKLAAFEKAKAGPANLSQEIKAIAAKSSNVLVRKNVGEGAAESTAKDGQPLDGVSLKKNEVIQLSILPNGNYGADSTRIDFRITRSGDGVTWDVADLISKLVNQTPPIEDKSAHWCFLKTTDGPVFLNTRHDSLNDNASLKAWKLGDTPSVFVNQSETPAPVWTILPPKSFFVHPGPADPVTVTWICPDDGEYRVEGTVTDAHPSGGDGVTMVLEYFADAEVGKKLKQLGEASFQNNPAPQMPNIPVAYAVMESDPQNARLHIRGDHEQLGDEIPRRWLSVFGGEGVAEQEGSGRRQLADWIAQHPISARVMVNRIWQGHFGRGLVATPNDFGSRGAAPTHPALLDWLAAQFRGGGYSVKSMHRLIMNTAAYQRAGAPITSVAVEQGDDNPSLAYFSRRRMTAEELRDSLLMISGNLDPSPSDAHPFPAEATWKFTQHAPFNAVYETNRRSVYLMVQRQLRHPFLALFDGADPNASTGVRQSSTVPTQALYFLNDPFFHTQAAGFAKRVIEYDENQRIDRAFDVALQRSPIDAEQEIVTRFLAEYPGSDLEKWSAYARVLMASNEFLYVD